MARSDSSRHHHELGWRLAAGGSTRTTDSLAPAGSRTAILSCRWVVPDTSWLKRGRRSRQLVVVAADAVDAFCAGA